MGGGGEEEEEGLAARPRDEDVDTPRFSSGSVPSRGGRTRTNVFTMVDVIAAEHPPARPTSMLCLWTAESEKVEREGTMGLGAVRKSDNDQAIARLL